MQRQFAASAEEFKPGSSTTIEGLGDPVALYRTEDGEFFATADICTHEKWSLGSDSDLEGSEIVCPLHMARFDLSSGKALCFPATVNLKTYPVEVDPSGDVYIVRDDV